ncbi:MAG TPA: M20/M25/M40 family metallo-hydrolase [Thermoanaerobaculaceae bacterium]|nr:M20/M25/M40 family metallo-hydrolase [Thermoanaerobaculaceae bacterium]HPS79026.1 M20/M25/M40 family metallo-hydrolase [Thermoanaerobaculaceae bacterium]
MSPPSEVLPSRILEASTQLLVELCGISSASGDVPGLRRLAGRLASELDRRGLTAQVVDQPDEDGMPQPVLLARGPAASEHPLVLVGHLDTVLEAAPPRLEDAKLWATGALDMKGGLATLLGALDLLAARGEKPPNDVLLVAVPDEEVSGTISERAVRRWGQTARTLLVLEPGERRGDAETLVAGRRGLFEWRLDVTGRAAHSGLAYWQGRSALAAAADWASRAQRLSETGAGVTVNVARLVAGDTDFVDNLAQHHALLGSTRRRNVVSERAVAEGEARFLSPADSERIMTSLQELTAAVADAWDLAMTFSQGVSVPPVDPHGPGGPLARRVTALAAARGWVLEVEEDRGGISFPNYVADPSLVPIVDGLGPVGDGMHTRDEHLDLRSFGRRIVLLADLLATL